MDNKKELPSNDRITECLLVSYSSTKGTDSSVLIVGKKGRNKTPEIINAFQNKEADELWKKLITKKVLENTK